MGPSSLKLRRASCFAARRLAILRSAEREAGWRKGWDSNPRWAFTHGGFQDRCLKPLGHPSNGISRRAFGLDASHGMPGKDASFRRRTAAEIALPSPRCPARPCAISPASSSRKLPVPLPARASRSVAKRLRPESRIAAAIARGLVKCFFGPCGFKDKTSVNVELIRHAAFGMQPIRQLPRLNPNIATFESLPELIQIHLESVKKTWGTFSVADARHGRSITTFCSYFSAHSIALNRKGSYLPLGSNSSREGYI